MTKEECKDMFHGEMTNLHAIALSIPDPHKGSLLSSIDRLKNYFGAQFDIETNDIGNFKQQQQQYDTGEVKSPVVPLGKLPEGHQIPEGTKAGVEAPRDKHGDNIPSPDPFKGLKFNEPAKSNPTTETK